MVEHMALLFFYAADMKDKYEYISEASCWADSGLPVGMYYVPAGLEFSLIVYSTVDLMHRTLANLLPYGIQLLYCLLGLGDR